MGDSRKGRREMAKILFVTFDGAGADKGGVGVDCLIVTLSAVQDAARIVANDLAARSPDAANPPKDAAAMRFVSVSEGSFAAQLALESAANGDERADDYGARAIDAILNWDGGYEDSALPDEAVEKLHGIYPALPMDMRVWLGGIENRLAVEIKRVIHAVKTATSEPERAVLHGWLKEVNWDKRTAQLHRYGVKGHIRLRFAESLDREMIRMATRYVEISGVGRFNANDDWTTVRVDAITAADTGGEPFDLDAFLNNPNRKIFRSEDVVRASEPFDVDAFNRAIREGRNV